MRKSFLAGILTVMTATVALAQSSNSHAKEVTIHDLNKTVELCRSLKDFKGYCADAAKACAAEPTYEDKKVCLEKQSK